MSWKSQLFLVLFVAERREGGGVEVRRCRVRKNYIQESRVLFKSIPFSKIFWNNEPNFSDDNEALLGLDWLVKYPQT